MFYIVEIYLWLFVDGVRTTDQLSIKRVVDVFHEVSWLTAKATEQVVNNFFAAQMALQLLEILKFFFLYNLEIEK